LSTAQVLRDLQAVDYRTVVAAMEDDERRLARLELWGDPASLPDDVDWLPWGSPLSEIVGQDVRPS
jgi:hypothetical protein